MSDLIQVFVNGEPADHSVYVAVRPRRWYVPLRPLLAVWFGLLRRWWYLEVGGMVVDFDEPPDAGAVVSARYETNYSQ